MKPDIHKIPADILKEYPPFDTAFLKEGADGELFPGRLIVVLDDDPTGVQTVHDVNVYTSPGRDTVFEAFENEERLFFILTNSRAMSSEETEACHRNLARLIDDAARKYGKDYIIISRSDSTLRGHWPLETETMRREIESRGARRFDGEIICPFFKEGGRFTINDIHYVLEGDSLVPASMTEFARDRTFPYSASFLPDWCEEKSAGKYAGEDVISISLEDLRCGSTDRAVNKLRSAENFRKIIVNAVTYDDLAVFSYALSSAMSWGKEFMVRSAACLVRVMGAISERPLLTPDELMDCGSSNGGLVVAGSHVGKTTRQLEALFSSPLPCEYIQELRHGGTEKYSAASPVAERAEKVISSAAAAADYAISGGRTAVIYTKRRRFDLDTDDPGKQLELSVMISGALTETVRRIVSLPSFIVAKGGITSSDIGTKALNVKKATVVGQILPGIPVWRLGQAGRFARLPFIIFPGNAGSEDDLRYIVELLSQ